MWQDRMKVVDLGKANDDIQDPPREAVLYRGLSGVDARFSQYLPADTGSRGNSIGAATVRRQVGDNTISDGGENCCAEK